MSLTTKSSSILSAAPFNLQLVLDQVETMSNPPKTTITNRTPISLPLALALLPFATSYKRLNSDGPQFVEQEAQQVSGNTAAEQRSAQCTS